MARRKSLAHPSTPRLAAVGRAVSLPVSRLVGGISGLYWADSAVAARKREELASRVQRGEDVVVVGIGPAGHNAGVGLVSVSKRDGIRLLANHEEERFSGRKHDDRYPVHAVERLRRFLDERGLAPADVGAYCATWNYVDGIASYVRTALEEFPVSLSLFRAVASPRMNYNHIQSAFAAPSRLGRDLGARSRIPILGLRHHDNHAYFSYGVSPFAGSASPTAIAVLDGYGDDASISTYVAQGSSLRLLHSNGSVFDSLGMFYSVLSSTQGGWTTLSSEGRYMGAAAWGDPERLTNPYYRALREIFFFAPGGQLFLNRALANWHRWGEAAPYTAALRSVIGDPIPPERMWNPDAVLDVDDVTHDAVTRGRCDKAAATQLVFEDALFHVIDHLLRTTKASQLVLTGGSALNCIANMRLLEHYDEDWYEQALGLGGRRLHLWVPPVPGDAGVTIGAAAQFAMRATGLPCQRLQHAFWCGDPPTRSELQRAAEEAGDIRLLELGDAGSVGALERIADLMAYVVSRDGIIGIVQGRAETGPRALGHRSILANANNPKTLENLNALVKARERIRPLAPMTTLEEAHRWFELSPGASDDGYDAYSYMVMTVRARPEARAMVPAVVHRDGTARIQIVREAIDPLIHAYLVALQRRIGVGISVNTSLNVGAPIAQSAAQALQTLRRSRGMDGVVFIAEGRAFLAFHDVLQPPKDGGARLRGWLEAWRAEGRQGSAEASRGARRRATPATDR